MDGVGRIESLEVIIADNDDDGLAIGTATDSSRRLLRTNPNWTR
jgi:hypothetical protein